jgi:SAM-dependent methyltransferase
MERVAFNLLRNMERSWWYRARTVAVSRALLRSQKKAEHVLDFGAGWGGMHDAISKEGVQVYAFEPDSLAREECEKRGYAAVYATETEAFSQTYDAIYLLDVLEHIEDDRAFLARARNALNPGGVLVISVPAFQFLWSVHDVEHQHFRRYTTALLRERFSEAGYMTRFTSYWNMLLFIPAVLARKLGKSGESSLSLPPVIDAVFFFVVWLETLLMYGIPLPFGTGIVAVAER